MINKLKDIELVNKIREENFIHIANLLDDKKLEVEYIGLLNG